MNFILLGIMVFRVLRSTPKFTAKLFHAGLQLTGFLFIVIALVAVFQYHDAKGATGGFANMYSVHSWVGMACVLLFGSQVGCQNTNKKH